MFEDELKKSLSELELTLISKRQDYGADNIRTFGNIGIIVRLSDKLARIRNLYGITDGSYKVKTAANEAIKDTWKDIAGYAILGMMGEEKK